MHSKDIVHRDLKPANFSMGLLHQSTELFIIDFGLSKLYIEKDQHIPFIQGKNLIGTARYASVNVHKVISFQPFKFHLSTI